MISCPICRMTNGAHKMDCQNRAYVESQLAELVSEWKSRHEAVCVSLRDSDMKLAALLQEKG